MSPGPAHKTMRETNIMSYARRMERGTETRKKGCWGELSFLSTRPPGRVSYPPGILGLLWKAGQRLNGGPSKVLLTKEVAYAETLLVVSDNTVKKHIQFTVLA